MNELIDYKVNAEVSSEQFIALLQSSTLGARRPTDDLACIEGMLEHANLCVSAWLEGKLIGIARCVTDFHYCCYLSDLAVDEQYQKLGIGKQLQTKVQEQLNEKCKLILIAAPAANDYYQQIGYTNNSRCWVLERASSIKC